MPVMLNAYIDFMGLHKHISEGWPKKGDGEQGGGKTMMAFRHRGRKCGTGNSLPIYSLSQLLSPLLVGHVVLLLLLMILLLCW